jgi:hypothetical protein
VGNEEELRREMQQLIAAPAHTKDPFDPAEMVHGWHARTQTAAPAKLVPTPA